MQLVLKNPYRIVGLLVGATAKEQERQIRRLKQFIDADQEPEDDFSFAFLGNLHRTIDSVTEAASNLNMDSDKMNAALFWFYKGNSITDEPAFDAIKEGNLDQGLNIWTKLTANGEVSQRNASAYNNLGTLYLSGFFNGQNANANILEQAISLKLKFIESDFIQDLKKLATDETYKATKEDLQLLFLNQIQNEIEKSGIISSSKFIEIISKQSFSAKEVFLKNFVQKPIEQIEKKIEETKTKRKGNKADAVILGKGLFQQSAEILSQLKSILGTADIKYASIADKVANEVLQCSIDYFNYCQENKSDKDYFEPAWKLAKSVEVIAIGKLTKDRIADSLNTLEEMKDKEISQAIQVLQSIKNAYEMNKAKISAEVHSIPLGYNQSINWSKVTEMIENSLDWNKVVQLVQEIIPPKNIDKIKNVHSAIKINEYKSLVEFLMSKLNYTQKNKIKYIFFWEVVKPLTAPTQKPITSTQTATNTQKPAISPQGEFSFEKNAWWILGGAGILLGLIVGLEAGCIITGIVGAGIGASINQNK